MSVRHFIVGLFFLGGLHMLMVFPSATTHAGERFELSVSPAISEWIVEPGRTVSKTFIASNSAAEPLPVKVFMGAMTTNEKIARQDEHIFDASKWFTVKEPDFILEPKEAREVHVTLHVPPDASPGGHYATIYFHKLSLATGNLGQTDVVGRAGALAFVTVTGPIQKELQAPGQVRIERDEGGFVFSAPLRNSGNVHMLPRVFFVIRDIQGHEVARLSPPPSIILPGTQREYSALWHPPLLGRFTVSTEITYGEKHAPVNIRAVALWQVPLRWIVPLVLITSTVYFGIFRIRHRWCRVWTELRGR